MVNNPDRFRQPTPAEVMKSVRHVNADLPDLTEKQMAFLNGILEGKNATQAYRDSRDCTNMSPATIGPNACRLYYHPKIQTWLSASRQAYLGLGILSRENHLKEMERLRELAIDTGDLKSAVKAEEVRGHVAGLRIERVEITHRNPADILKEINNMDPELAKRLGEQYGITVAPVIEHDPLEHLTPAETTPDP